MQYGTGAEIAAPFITKGDVFCLSLTWSGLPGPQNVDLTVIIQQTNGEIVRESFLALTVVNGSGQANVFTPPIQESGWVINANVNTELGATAVLPNTIYCYLGISPTQIGGVPAFPQQFLCADYVYVGHPLIYPASFYRHPEDDPGGIQIVQPANPAPGASLSIGYTTFESIRWNSILFSFTASAAVANRNLVFAINQGATTVFEASWPAAVTAGQTVNPSAVRIASNPNNSNVQYPSIALPETFFTATFGTTLTFLLVAVGMQAADQFSGIQIVQERKIIPSLV